jgi:hypothetical protein
MFLKLILFLFFATWDKTQGFVHVMQASILPPNPEIDSSNNKHDANRYLAFKAN